VDEPIWLDRTTIDAMHYDQMQQHGGLFGIKDENALESALARPRHKWKYEPKSDLFALAASYGYGLANNHAYNDGNKRIAFVTMYTFLGVNGWEITAPEPHVVQIMLEVASGICEEKQLATWLRKHVEPFAG
jgi:death on curing protein